MIMGYKEDRAYTDYNHKLAEEQIYATYGISIYKPQTEEEKQRAVNDDIYKAIDYIGFIEKSGKPFAIQERTRSAKAAAYNDITIRFERPYNPNADRVQSEAYKLNYFFYQNPDVPFLMMYAVRGEDKNIASISMDSFVKYAFIDLRKLYYLIQNGNIVFEPWNKSRTSYTDKYVMHVPIKENPDKSSVFVTFDVAQLCNWFPGVVLEHKGFNAPTRSISPGKEPHHLHAQMQGSIFPEQVDYLTALMIGRNFQYDANIERIIKNMSMTQAYYAIRQIKEDLRQFTYNFPPLAVPNTPLSRCYQNPQKGLGITI